MTALQQIQGAGVAAMPSWPRLLSADLAAAYLGISRRNMLERVAQHMLPAPLKIGERTLWDIRALDRFVDALMGVTPASAANDEEPSNEGW
jgi:predicted DNA-binding transcriptional regulator AlpA